MEKIKKDNSPEAKRKRREEAERLQKEAKMRKAKREKERAEHNFAKHFRKLLHQSEVGRNKIDALNQIRKYLQPGSKRHTLAKKIFCEDKNLKPQEFDNLRSEFLENKKREEARKQTVEYNAAQRSGFHEGAKVAGSNLRKIDK